MTDFNPIPASELRPREIQMFAELEGDRLYLTIPDGRVYDIENDPIKALGLLDHLCGKTWMDGEYACQAIHAMANAANWKIHPLI